MATDEDRDSARKRLDIHRRNLNKLLEQAANYTDGVPIHVSNQIDEQRVSIAALEAIAYPPQKDATQVFVARVGDGNGGNWDMLFSQFVLLNTRMTQAEERDQRILTEQGMASQWRMVAGQDIEALKRDTEAGERGRRRNFFLQMVNIALLVMSVAMVVALAIRIMGG